ncbi:MAG: HlyD family efflux transporter periplasmic adaptor subunit, partial [Bacillota bacterium]|nr:HlyD family efflux transporter periplasmic adaptor subunit [Bacillota bacterium]
QKRIIFSIIALLFIVGAVFLVKYVLNKSENKDKEGQTAVVTRGRLESFVTGWGTVVPKEEKKLGEDLKGKITQIYVKAGDSVKAGDKIFTVDDTEIRADLAKAKTALSDAEDSLRSINDEIKNLELKAPFDGKLIDLQAKNVESGQDITSGTALGTFVDDSVLKLSLYFSYGFVDKIKPGMDASVSIPVSMSTVPGKVESVEKVKKITDQGSVLFRVNLKINNPGTLKKDMVASAIIKTPGGNIMPAEDGKLQYNREEALSFKASGEVLSEDIEEFKVYSAGQVICRLKSDKDPQSKIESAAQTLKDAQDEYAKRQKAMQESTMVSPINGVVTSILKEVGDEIENYGTDVVVIADLTKMYVDINVQEMDVSKVTVGVPVQISYDKTDGTSTVTGTVNSISLNAKSDSSKGGGVAYFPARITLDNPGDLRPGVGVNYRISAMVKENCLMVPSAAVTYTESGTAVFVKTVDGRKIDKPAKIDKKLVPEGYEAAIVEIGVSDSQNTEIKSGLVEGDTVSLIGQPDQNADGMSAGASVTVG